MAWVAMNRAARCAAASCSPRWSFTDLVWWRAAVVVSMSCAPNPAWPGWRFSRRASPRTSRGSPTGDRPGP
ncbi:hypothetical protein ACFFX0_15945 [Citricoccus parietis]|uniref:Uncharacterized protein n=1 Tax=Citricoccus parietis TaxID=592307 RepID=A0ABV5G126_9MICC